jgi:hypothetical protein
LDERPWVPRWMVARDGDIDEQIRIPEVVEQQRARERSRWHR